MCFLVWTKHTRNVVPQLYLHRGYEEIRNNTKIFCNPLFLGTESNTNFQYDVQCIFKKGRGSRKPGGFLQILQISQNTVETLAEVYADISLWRKKYF
jgi:hypothetical protein